VLALASEASLIEAGCFQVGRIWNLQTRSVREFLGDCDDQRQNNCTVPRYLVEIYE
jgi:hypothetical protein